MARRSIRTRHTRIDDGRSGSPSEYWPWPALRRRRLAVQFGLAVFDLRHHTDTFSNLYLQALVVFVVLAFRVDHVDFNVYREDQLAT